MDICQSCGGVIGRDCWNPTECAEISYQIMQQDYVGDCYHDFMMQPVWRTIYDITKYRFKRTKVYNLIADAKRKLCGEPEFDPDEIPF